jgi:hypothetical protein
MSTVYTLVATGTTDIQVASGRVTLYGFALLEDAGTPAVAKAIFRNGTSTAGDAVMPINFLASESVREWFPQGILFPNGLFLDKTSGSLSGAVFLG